MNISVGVAAHTLGTDTTALLRRADHALTVAKATGTVIRAHPGPPPPLPRRRPPRGTADTEPPPPTAPEPTNPPTGGR